MRFLASLADVSAFIALILGTLGMLDSIFGDSAGTDGGRRVFWISLPLLVVGLAWVLR